MHRRKFLRGFASSLGAAAVPLTSAAKAVATLSNAPAKIIPFHYGWACVHAQRNNGISAADISRVFKVSPQEASSLMKRMELRGVIGPTGLDGRSQPTRTWQSWDTKHPARAKGSAQDIVEKDWNADRGMKARAKFRARVTKISVDPSCKYGAWTPRTPTLVL